MKRTLLSITCIILSSALLAQEEDVKKKAAETKITSKDFKDGWTRGGFFAINGSNVLFKNWAAGGSGQTGIVFTGSLFAVNKRGKGLWENYLDLILLTLCC